MAGDDIRIHDATNVAYNRDFGYDDLNRLISADSGSGLWGAGTYQYEAMGNMTSLHIGSRSLSFAYVGSTPKIQSVSGTDPASVSYDNAGNDITASFYSARNLLLLVRDPGQMPDRGQMTYLDYSYDGRGVRVMTSWKRPGPYPQTRRSVYTPDLHLLAQSDWASGGRLAGAFLGTDYVGFADQPFAQTFTDLSQPTRYTFTDHLGTPILQTDATAAIVWRAEYEPYGSIYTYRAGDAADLQILRLPGQEAPESLNSAGYNIFRWYRAEWGRYTQTDPAGLQAGTNVFSYVNEDPIDAIDPFGLKAELVCKAVGTNGIPIPGSKHCRLRASCEKCPEKPETDSTFGMEWTGKPPYTINEWPYPQGLQNYDTTIPVTISGKSDCDFAKCVRAYNNLFRKGYTGQGTKYVPKYSITGPNSNSYANKLLSVCGGSAPFPVGALGSGDDY